MNLRLDKLQLNLKMKRLMIILALNIVIQCSAVRIAIIGGGVGGTASAYFLRELLASHEPHIDVFESREVGGRLRLATLGGRDYEAGGAVVHPRNKHMLNFVKELGLSHRKQHPGGKLGLYDGREFLFTESDWGLVTTFKMLWRYGFSLWTLDSLVKKKLGQFDRIYAHQEKGASFTTVKALIQSMGSDMVKDARTSARKGFLEAGLSKRLVEELVEATLRINYGQSIENAHQFVGFVSVAGAEGDLWSITDGNYQVPLHLLEASDANLIPHRVHKIKALETGYELHWLDDTKAENASYDAVIIANPLTGDYKETLELPQLKYPVPKRRMHRLVSTFVQGTVNYTFFGINEEDGIGDVVSIWSNPWFNCMSRVFPVDGSALTPIETPVYKIFSSEPLSDEQLDLLFSDRSEIQEHDWFAYPHYSYNEPLEGSFVLREGLFYLNAIEWAASAMEMSAVGAKNVALLARNYLKPDDAARNVDITSSGNKLEL